VSDTDLALLAGALTLGFVGSGHCLGMCGGISAALSSASAAKGKGSALASSLLHSFGRLSTYALLGAVVAQLGRWGDAWVGLGPSIRVLAGLLIAMMGLRAMGFRVGGDALDRIGLFAWRRLQPLRLGLGPVDRAWKEVAAGALWGWLPCGLVYAALASAAASGSAGLGALFMFCFGLGTAPSVVLAGSAGGRFSQALRDASLRRVAGALLVIFGFWTLQGALLQHGPHAAHAEAETSLEAHH